MANDAWTLLTHYFNAPQAGLLESILKSEGIEVQVFDRQTGSLLGYMAPAIPIRVMVRERDMERAKELLKDLELSSPADES
jgi:hypothetical protein